LFTPLAVGVLHTSDVLPCCGSALPVHEKPMAPPVQPTMFASTLHPDATAVVSMQQ
jgi:hypothetical protein